VRQLQQVLFTARYQISTSRSVSSKSSIPRLIPKQAPYQIHNTLLQANQIVPSPQRLNEHYLPPIRFCEPRYCTKLVDRLSLHNCFACCTTFGDGVVVRVPVYLLNILRRLRENGDGWEECIKEVLKEAMRMGIRDISIISRMDN
jgi:hypothetical protein